jgi:hypothetical protein
MVDESTQNRAMISKAVIMLNEKVDKEKLRDIEIARLDKLADQYFNAACAGEHKSASTYLEILKEKTAILGLHAPVESRMAVINYDVSILREQYELLVRGAAGNSSVPLE